MINQSAMKEAFKAEIGKYTIFEIAPIQEQLRNDILKRLQETLKSYSAKVEQDVINSQLKNFT